MHMQTRVIWAGLLLMAAQAITAADTDDDTTQPGAPAGSATQTQPADADPATDPQKQPKAAPDDNTNDNSGGSDPDCG